MKPFIIVLLCLCVSASNFAQLSTITIGGNKKAWVGERIGLTDVTIHYNRPAVKGREGKIWGALVPEGFFTPDFSNTKGTPWRAGANENTTISFSNDVLVEGKELAAGTYGLFVAYKPEQSTVIFSKNATSWGSYFYKEEEDALRVNIKPVTSNRSVEWMSFEFAGDSDSSAIIHLSWEKLSFPFRVSTKLVEDQLNSFRRELRGEKGFSWQAFNQAAQWCLTHRVNIDEALLWSDSATSQLFGGDKQFPALATKSQLLSLAGRENEADEVMRRAMPFASMIDAHQYARQLLAAKKNQQALEIFKLNARNNPKQFTTYMGLARGYSALGDFQSALKNAQLALPLAPDPGNKTNVEAAIIKLKERKDIN